MNAIVVVATILLVAQVGPDLKDRKPHPFAPSLPLLTKEENAKIDAIIDRFIDYDIGKLKGEAGKKALKDFNDLGPEAIFNLIDGLNRAANMEGSCPAVIIGRKVAKILGSTNDMELLTFAKENIGADVKAKRHINVLQDLQFNILLRKGVLQRQAAAAAKAGKSLAAMSLADLEKSASKERGPQLKAMLTEAEKRPGAKAVDVLLIGVGSTDADIAKLSQGLLAKNMQRQSVDVLKSMLQHERNDVRIAAAQAVGAKKLRLGAELIELLQDGDDDVRQAARRALVRLGDGGDYGPEPGASSSDRATAVERWREWLSRQK
jgi:HEAT repeat protein